MDRDLFYLDLFNAALTLNCIFKPAFAVKLPGDSCLDRFLVVFLVVNQREHL